MPPVICFIRGINVGGRNKVKMAQLRELLQSLGLLQPRTVLQSGNAIFYSEDTDLSALSAKIMAGMRSEFGFDAHVMLRGASDFRSVIRRAPFTAAQLESPAKAAVVFLDSAPSDSEAARLRESNPGREIIHASWRELYVFYSDGMARSKLTNARIEAKLGGKATVRNWNTCQRMLRLLDELAPHPSAAT